MTGYLAQVWGRQLALTGVEPLTINGFEAATGVTRQKTRAGLVDLRLVAIRTAPDQIFRFVFATPPQLDPAAGDRASAHRPTASGG